MVGCATCSQGGNYFSFGSVTRRSPRRYKRRSPKRSPRRSPRRYKRRSPKRSPRRTPRRYKRKSPKRKVVKDKRDRKIGTRLSARTVYDENGQKALGKSFRILQKDGKYKMKVLRLRRDGVPYFSTKFGKVETVMSNSVRFNKHLDNDNIHHYNILYNNNWLRGPSSDDMTGILNSWPNKGINIAPGGVAQPIRTSLLPKIAPGTRRGNNFGYKKMGHMHFGKLCFGA